MIDSDLSLEQDLIEPHRRWALDPIYGEHGEFVKALMQKHPMCGQSVVPDRMSYLVASSPGMYRDLETKREEFLMKNCGTFVVKPDADAEDSLVCDCGRVSKSLAGHKAHMRNCDVARANYKPEGVSVKLIEKKKEPELAEIVEG